MRQLGLHPDDTPDAQAQRALKNANRFLTLCLHVWLDADANAAFLTPQAHSYDIPPSCFIRVS
jgi:hypothetical protein